MPIKNEQFHTIQIKNDLIQFYRKKIGENFLGNYWRPATSQERQQLNNAK